MTTIVYDVFVDGKVKETLQPREQRLQDIRLFIKSEAARLISLYGSNVYLNRRIVYK
ncbi:hypothetical protein RB620_16520 [Paenibacillus sp. LHD-117]|uniref:hypothetical protein n=1 Tax=Paenibacillus sp. LHD-117 TaxID=3071412 RepID=UPI0027DF849D|nr:hypothetical protein [Paenibacillus sp. LHD-117]MDQ6421033.1 hypothetical protein [Paenibacillus sp. LHD-117]